MVIGLLALSVVVAPTPSAQANEAATGVLEFDGNATLPNFPCPPPTPGSFPCTGTWSGAIRGSLSGDHIVGDAHHPWAVEIVIPDAVATFAYFDLVRPGVPCTEGFARATGSASGGLGEVFGAYARPPGLVPIAPDAIQITWKFDWRRVGLTAVMQFSEVSVTLTIPTSDTTSELITVITAGAGNGTGVFAPDMQPAHLQACETGTAPDPQVEMGAVVAGSAAFAAVSP